MKSGLKKLLLLYHTVKYLKFTQIFYRVYYRLIKPRNRVLESDITRRSWYWSGPNIHSQSLFGNGRVSFLSEEGVLSSPSSWNNPIKDKLWLYNLHYFDDLNSIDYVNRKDVHVQLIDDWINENAFCMGNGWEPYPISLRLVNWIKWFSRNEVIASRHLYSIAQQADVLLQIPEYHLLGNHLFANAKALTFVGCFLKGDLAERCLDKGLKILDREMDEQFLEDGGHFELSPMYHSILLWDLLELIDLALLSDEQKLQQRLGHWSVVASRALYWLRVMTHPDGEVSFFNDAAMGMAPRLENILEYGEKLGLIASDIESEVVTLKSSGYTRIANERYFLLIDHANIGPDYLPGHAHADTLSFEMSIEKQRVFVNSGTSLYGLSRERLRQRKTAAHNSVEVDGEDSSEVWSGFRVARRAYVSPLVFSSNDSEVNICCSHNGYMRLPGNVTHTRNWTCHDRGITITDTLSGRFTKAVAFFHLHPEVQVECVERVCILRLPEGQMVRLFSDAQFILEDTTWNPRFGVSMPTKKVCMVFSNNSLSVKIDI